MAEKEERIYVRKYGEDNPCDTCEDKSGDECDFCVKNYEWNSSIPRQEAINRMAKALVEYEKTNNPNACEWTDLKERTKDIYRERAEAALNALLEGK